MNFWTQHPHTDGVTFNDGFQSLFKPATITGIVETDLYPLAIVHILFHNWKKRTFEMSRGRIRTPTGTGNPFDSGQSDSLSLIRDVGNRTSSSSGHDRGRLLAGSKGIERNINVIAKT